MNKFFVEIYHSTARNSRGRGLNQIDYFEKQREWLRYLNSLAVRQTQHLIIIENRIQILDPETVNRSIQHEPPLLLLFIFIGFPFNKSFLLYDLSDYSITPVICQEINIPI